MPLDDVAHVLRLTHTMCYYTVQGRTFQSHMVLLDTDHRHFSRRALIVGLSRATNGRLVHIPTEEEADVFTGGGAGHTEFVEISKWTLDRELPRYTKKLSFPSAPKLQSALRKEGITLSLSALKELTSESGARQVLQPPPTYGRRRMAATLRQVG